MRRHPRSTGGKTEREFPVSFHVFVWSSAGFSKFREAVSRLSSAFLFLGRSKRQRWKSYRRYRVYRRQSIAPWLFLVSGSGSTCKSGFSFVTISRFRTVFFVSAFVSFSVRIILPATLFSSDTSRHVDSTISALFFLTKFRARSVSGNTGCCRPVRDCSRTLRYIQSFQRSTGLPNLPEYNSRY